MKAHSLVFKGLLILAACSTMLLPAAPAALAQPDLMEVEAAGNWQVVPITATATLYALDMIGAADGWAGGTSGLVLHYDGAAWNELATTLSDVLFNIDMIDANLGFATTYQGNILLYSGGQWAQQAHLSPVLLTGISMLDANNGWAVGYMGGIYRYQNGTWQEWAMMPYLFQSVDMVGPNDGWIVGRTGVRVHWNGSAWQVIGTPTDAWFLDVDMVSSSDGWAVGHDGVIYHYNGASWSPVSSPVPDVSLWSVSMASSSDGWAVGTGGTILHYNGSTWRQVDSPVIQDLHNVDVISRDNIWAVGKSGTILHSTGIVDLTSSTKSVSSRRASPGDTLTYTIRVRNTGSLTATGVMVTDPTPANASYVAGSATTSQGTIQGTNPLVVSVGNVAPGGLVTISFRVVVGNPSPSCWFLVNQATISAVGEEPVIRAAGSSIGDCLSGFLPLVQR